MTRTALTLSLAVAALALAVADASAQFPGTQHAATWNVNFNRDANGQISGIRIGGPGFTPGRGHIDPSRIDPSIRPGVVRPGVVRPRPVPSNQWSHNGWQPAGPAIVTPNRIQYVDRWGNVHTRNEQVDHSAFDPDREWSQHNGTRRTVRRPVYDRFGRVVGYEEGIVWNNSRTGQEHADTRVVTWDDHGNSHETDVVRSVGPDFQD